MAVDDIDRRLHAEIRERQHHRERIAQLASGESLALPPEVVTYLDRMRALGFGQRLVEIERDSWILIAAQIPDEVSDFMAIKRAQIEHEPLRQLYLDIGGLSDCAHDDSRLPELADRVVTFIEAAAAVAQAVPVQLTMDYMVSDELAHLLDGALCETFPGAQRLLGLLEERGWKGWTNIRRNPAST